MLSRKMLALLSNALLTGTGALSQVTAQEKPTVAQTPLAGRMTATPKPSPDVQTLLDKADALSRQNKWDDAMKGYDAALAKARELLDQDGEANTLKGIGNVYSNTGQFQKALEQYQQALPINRAAGDKKVEAVVLNNIGEVYVATGQSQKALEQYQQSLSLFRAAGDKSGEAEALQNSGEVHENIGQPQKALEQYRQAIALRERIRESVGANPQSRQAYLLSILDSYYRAIALLLKQKQNPEAFALAQKTKARSLLDILASGKAEVSSVLTPEERKEEEELIQQADFLNQQMVKQGVENQVGAKQRFAALAEQLKQSEQKLAILTDTLNARHPDLAVKRIARTATIEETGRFLPEDAALLEYLQVSKEQFALFVVTKKSGKTQIHVVMLPVKEKVLAKQCAAFHAACANPRKEWKPLAKQMYSLLMRKAEPLLAGRKQLIVCPDGPLWEVAFGALTDTQNRPLLSRFTISMAYSATGAQAALSPRANLMSIG